MKRKFKIILLIALAIETANFPAGLGYALDPGSSSRDPWYMQMLGFEWGALHVSGSIVVDVLTRGYSSSPPKALGLVGQASSGQMFVVPGSHLPAPQSRLESFFHNHRAVNLPPWVALAILLGGGYLSTVFVLLAITFGFSCFLKWRRKWSTGSATSASQP